MPYKKNVPSAQDFVGSATAPQGGSAAADDTTVQAQQPVQEVRPLDTTQGPRPFRPSQGFAPRSNQFDGGVTQPAMQALQGPTEEVMGILDVQMEGHGFLRPKFVPSNKDIYISASQIR